MRILHLEKAVLQSSIAPNINTSIPIAVYLAVVSVIQKDVKLLEGQENERINSLEWKHHWKQFCIKEIKGLLDFYL